MNIRERFVNEIINKARTTQYNNRTYFVGKDIAEVLGYSNPSNAITKHCTGARKIEVPAKMGTKKMIAIPEGDIYRLIIMSKLPKAKIFKEWVFDVVLPQIRETGDYLKSTEEEYDMITSALNDIRNRIAG